MPATYLTNSEPVIAWRGRRGILPVNWVERAVKATSEGALPGETRRKSRKNWTALVCTLIRRTTPTPK